MESRVEDGKIINICKCGKEIKDSYQYHLHGQEKCKDCKCKDRDK